ncbi:MAG: hypothetical protein RLZZ517_235 [Candidatus Parcubacteria bacterium]|jgi:hypothetical protein
MKKIKKYINLITVQTLVFLFSISNVFAAPTTSDTSAKVTEATTNIGKKTLNEVVVDFIVLLSRYVIRLLLVLIIFMFLFGLMKYMFKGQGSDTARAEGRKLMFWGVVGIFVVTSWMALVAIIASFIGHEGVFIPQF